MVPFASLHRSLLDRERVKVLRVASHSVRERTGHGQGPSTWSRFLCPAWRGRRQGASRHGLPDGECRGPERQFPTMPAIEIGRTIR